MRRQSHCDNSMLIGAIAPLTSPGWIGAGRHLLAGIQLGIREVNSSGVHDKSIKLLVEDTAADARKAAAAVDRFARAGVLAIVGEYHSVAARAAASRAHQLRIPYVCSSAVLDELIEEPTDFVGRLSPPQSRGWRLFAEYLISSGHLRVAVALVESIYWEAGFQILRTNLEAAGGQIVRINVSDVSLTELGDRLAADEASALILLVGAPEPAAAIVQSIRQDHRFSELLIGAPAGQPELAELHDILGGAGTEIPFLRYLPERLSEEGLRITQLLCKELEELPSFVALEGYDSAKVVAELLRLRNKGVPMNDVWPRISVSGSRGLIKFASLPGMKVWQWDDAPVQIAHRDPKEPEAIRVLI